jgi:hypothetical protein
MDQFVVRNVCLCTVAHLLELKGPKFKALALKLACKARFHLQRTAFQP